MLGLEYLLVQSGLAMTLIDLLFVVLALLVYVLFYFLLKEYFFENRKIRNKLFMNIDEPPLKLFFYFLFSLLMLVIGLYMSYIGILEPLKVFKIKGGLQHGYSLALFGTSFSFLLLMFNVVFLRALFFGVRNNNKR